MLRFTALVAALVAVAHAQTLLYPYRQISYPLGASWSTNQQLLSQPLLTGQSWTYSPLLPVQSIYRLQPAYQFGSYQWQPNSYSFRYQSQGLSPAPLTTIAPRSYTPVQYSAGYQPTSYSYQRGGRALAIAAPQQQQIQQGQYVAPVQAPTQGILGSEQQVRAQIADPTYQQQQIQQVGQIGQVAPVPVPVTIPAQIPVQSVPVTGYQPQQQQIIAQQQPLTVPGAFVPVQPQPQQVYGQPEPQFVAHPTSHFVQPQIAVPTVPVVQAAAPIPSVPISYAAPISQPEGVVVGQTLTQPQSIPVGQGHHQESLGHHQVSHVSIPGQVGIGGGYTSSAFYEASPATGVVIPADPLVASNVKVAGKVVEPVHGQQHHQTIQTGVTGVQSYEGKQQQPQAVDQIQPSGKTQQSVRQ